MTSPKRHTRRTQQKAETRKIILQTAKLLFTQKGFEKTTMRAIADEAGVAVGTLFVHFPDKPSLLAAALYDDLEGALAQAFASLPDKDVETKLLYLVRQLYQYYARNPTLSRILVKETLFLSGEWGHTFANQVEKFVKQITTLLLTAQQAGQVSTDVDCELAAEIFMSHYLTVLIQGLRSEDFKPDIQVSLLTRLLNPLFLSFHS